MKKFEVVHDFPCALESLIAAREARYDIPSPFPEIIGAEIEDRNEKDGIVYQTRRVFIKSSIPQPFAKMLPHGRFEVIEKSEYNRGTGDYYLYSWLTSMERVLIFREESFYQELEGDGMKRSRRKILFETEAKIPFVSRTVENLVVHQFSQKTEEDREILTRLVLEQG